MFARASVVLQDHDGMHRGSGTTPNALKSAAAILNEMLIYRSITGVYAH